MSELDANNLDRLTSVAKGVVGACPLIGPLASEAIGHLIPNQRLDRVVQFLRELEDEVCQVDSRLLNVESNLRKPEGLGLLEEGLVQAARAISQERQERLARLIGRALTEEKVKYAESKKLLNLFHELTDPEVLWLIYYSTSPTMESEFHKQLIEDNPDVLKPVSREMGATQEQIDRGAMQESYKSTLLRLGLVKEHGRSLQISALGGLLVRYIEARSEQNSES